MKTLLLFVLSMVVALLLCEVGIRIFEATRGKEISYEALYKNSTIPLDTLNYNESPVSRSKPKEEFRVLSFGDSFAYSIVRAPNHYHGIAANRATELSQRLVTVVNLGEPAVSFYQYMKAYEVWGKLLEHDGVVFNIYLGNDLLDVAYRYVSTDVKVNRLFLNLDRDPATGQSRSVSIPKKFTLRILDYAYAAQLIFQGVVKPASVPPQATGLYNFAVLKLAEDKWLNILNTQLDNFDATKLARLREGYLAVIKFASFVSKIRSDGKKVLVMLAPNQVQVSDPTLDLVMTKFRHDRALFDLDLSAALIYQIFQDFDPGVGLTYLRTPLRCAEQQGAPTYYETDTHWSVEGNRVVGQYLGSWLANRWLGVPPVPDKQCDDKVDLSPERVFIYNLQIKPLFEAANRAN